MAVTRIIPSIVDTQLGIPAYNDAVSMIVSKAVAVVDKFELGTPYLLTSISDAENLGLDAAYDTANNVALYQHITEFFTQAGANAVLWIVGVQTSTSFATYFNGDTFMKLVLAKTVEQNWDRRPRRLAVAFQTNMTPPTDTGPTSAMTDFFPAEVIQCITSLNAAIQTWQTEGFFISAIVDGAGMRQYVRGASEPVQMNANAVQFLPDASTLNAGYVALCITGTQANTVASVGHALGVMAARNVAVSIGAVALGPVAQTGYFTNGSPVGGFVTSVFINLGQNQYLFLRRFAGEGGLYYNDGGTVNSRLMALSSLNFVNVANAICSDAVTYFTKLLNSNVPVTTRGELEGGWVSSTIANFESQYVNQRLIGQEASGVRVTLTAHNGDFVGTGAIDVRIEILPMKPMQEVYVYTMFVKSFE